MNNISLYYIPITEEVRNFCLNYLLTAKRLTDLLETRQVFGEVREQKLGMNINSVEFRKKAAERAPYPLNSVWTFVLACLA